MICFYSFQSHTIWWWFLAITHGYSTLIFLAKNLQAIQAFYRTAKTSKGDYKEGVGTTGLITRLIKTSFTVTKEGAIPVLTGILLYAPLDESVLRYCAAVDVIFTCQWFMALISRLPGIGLYVHMLGKVTGTVLSFFATYAWSLIGYAIAFHMILPSDGPFGHFGNALIKVILYWLENVSQAKKKNCL